LFPASTIGKLFRLSRGVPRLINVLCDRALLGAFVQGQGWVNKSTLVKAAREVFGEAKAQGQQYKKTSKWLLAILMLTVFGSVLAVTYFNNFNNHESQPVAIDITEPPQLDTLQKPADQTRLDTLQWPADQPNYRSKVMAYQALFKHWDVTYVPHEHITACQQAQAHGLLCLHKLGSLGSLRRINRPAVLRLLDEQSQEFYATLTSLSGKTATFVIGTETRTVAVKDLELLWLGGYTLLWRMPPEYQGNILPGYQGPEVEWLNKQLALIQGRTAQPRKNPVFDDALVKQVKEFQLAKGLVPDGIVGTQTVIQLNTVIGSGIPILIDKHEDNQ
jgi:general secretion pathway protein A